MSILSRLPFIYDVATSEQNWTSALDHLCDASGSKGASLFSSDNTGYPFKVQALSSFYETKQAALSTYFDLHEQIDTEAALFTFEQKPFLRITDEDIWPDFMKSGDRPDLRFLTENFDVFRRAAYNISRSKAWNSAIALQYGTEVNKFDDNKNQNANILTIHLGKALEINRFYSRLRQKYNAVLGALDHVSVGICIALQGGEVITKNSYAQKLFESNDGLSLNLHNQIKLLDSNTNRSLNFFIDQCADTAIGRSNTSEKTILSNRKTANDPYLVEVSPLRDGDNEFGGNIAGALILLIDPSDSPSIDSRPFQQLFGLTNAEAKIVELLFQGRTEEEIAEIRNVSLHTIRNQRKSIYLKAAVKSRTQLIRKAIAISPPIN